MHPLIYYCAVWGVPNRPARTTQKNITVYHNQHQITDHTCTIIYPLLTLQHKLVVQSWPDPSCPHYRGEEIDFIYQVPTFSLWAGVIRTDHETSSVMSTVLLSWSHGLGPAAIQSWVMRLGSSQLMSGERGHKLAVDGQKSVFACLPWLHACTQSVSEYHALSKCSFEIK